MITALTACGFSFDDAITLSENYQYDFSPILHERGQEDVDICESEPVSTEGR